MTLLRVASAGHTRQAGVESRPGTNDLPPVVAEAAEREVVAPVAPAAEWLEVPVALVERAGTTGGATTGAPNAGTTTGTGVNSNAAGQRHGGNTRNSRDNINNQDRNPRR